MEDLHLHLVVFMVCCIPFCISAHVVVDKTFRKKILYGYATIGNTKWNNLAVKCTLKNNRPLFKGACYVEAAFAISY